MAYSGRYKVKNPSKYKGDFQNVKYRSLWERQAFKWLDLNPSIIKWSSEEVVVPYKCKTDGKMHRYFVDLYIETIQGEYLIEIKPEKETKEPKRRSRKSQKYLKEVMTYVKNQSKWEAAGRYAQNRGMKFEVWTENTLKAMGIKLLT